MNKIYIIGILFFCSCGVQKPIQNSGDASTKKETAPNNSIQTKYNNLTLADYLRNLPGIQVTNSAGSINVSVRGQLSFSGDTSPIFVVNGALVGTNYEGSSKVGRCK